MSMEVYLMRHGEARSALEDPARSLTERGTEAVRNMAAWAEGAGVKVGQIRHSGITRAEQTAVILAERLEPPGGLVAVKGLDPEDEVRPVAELIVARRESIMLVGHMPFLDSLARFLLDGDPGGGLLRFPPAGMVSLSSREGKWSINWAMAPDGL
jgi:phosphohistidine phosphatase